MSQAHGNIGVEFLESFSTAVGLRANLDSVVGRSQLHSRLEVIRYKHLMKGFDGYREGKASELRCDLVYIVAGGLEVLS